MGARPKHPVSTPSPSSLFLCSLPRLSTFHLGEFFQDHPDPNIPLWSLSAQQLYKHDPPPWDSVQHCFVFTIYCEYMAHFHYQTRESLITTYIPSGAKYWEHNGFSINTSEMNQDQSEKSQFSWRSGIIDVYNIYQTNHAIQILHEER